MQWNSETRNLSDLKPAAYNPRKISKEDKQQLAASLSKFDVADPIIINKDNTIIGGHQRFFVLKEQGVDCVDVRVPVDQLTEDQEKELNLRLNKNNGEWDMDLLKDFDQELLKDVGFEDLDLDKMFPVEIDEECDTVPEPPEDPITKTGDLYQLGKHRLLCGDSTNIDDVERLMDGKKADMVFTDPPYNVASESKNFAADVSKAMSELSNSEWDKGFDTTKVVPILQDFISKNSVTYIFTNHFLFGELYHQYKGWADFVSYCVWAKPNPMPSLSKRHWTWNTELCLYATKGKHISNFHEGTHELSCWQITKLSDGTHPTQKPTELCIKAIKFSSNYGQTVLDLFLGSGSTLIACEKTDRICYGMELDPKYCDVIVKRWEDLTGEKAQRL